MNKNSNRVLIIVFAGLILFALYPFLIHRLTGDWQTSGQFGDTFGFVNSLVASITLLLVLATFNIQRKQLEGTRQSHLLQITPIMGLSVAEYFLRFPGSEKGDKYFPYPESGLTLEIKNVSDTPIVRLEGRITVQVPGAQDRILDEFFLWPLLGQKGDTTEPQRCTIRCADNESLCQYYNALAGLGNRPVLVCHFKYKNILGGCFEFRREAKLLAWREGKDVARVLKEQSDIFNSTDPKIHHIIEKMRQTTHETFWPTYYKCASEYLGCGCRKDLTFQVSQTLGPDAITFQAITSSEYDALHFEDVIGGNGKG